MDERDDNPWANAVDARVKAAVDQSMQSPDIESELQLEEVDPDSCGFISHYQGLQLWHLLDLAIGFGMLMYAGIKMDDVSTLCTVVILFVATCVTVRGVAGALALWTDRHCQYFGLLISEKVSPVLSCTWLVMTCFQLISPGHVHSYLAQHHMVLPFVLEWEGHHSLIVALLFFGAFLLECVRWQLTQSLQKKILALEQQQETRERQRAERQRQLPDRPWWWTRGRNNSRTQRDELDPNDPLTDALLPVTAAEREQASNNKGWSFFGRRRTKFSQQSNRTGGNHGAHYSNLREDASVDFASVQEEWASRTEEDPFWWSRDEESAANNNNSNHSKNKKDDTSWADNK